MKLCIIRIKESSLKYFGRSLAECEHAAEKLEDTAANFTDVGVDINEVGKQLADLQVIQTKKIQLASLSSKVPYFLYRSKYTAKAARWLSTSCNPSRERAHPFLFLFETCSFWYVLALRSQRSKTRVIENPLEGSGQSWTYFSLNGHKRTT